MQRGASRRASHRTAQTCAKMNARRMAPAFVIVASMKRVERVRLYPTPRQQSILQFMLDVTRQLYNALLQQRRDVYRLRGVGIPSRDQYAELTALRREDARIAAVYRESEDAVSYTHLTLPTI